MNKLLVFLFVFSTNLYAQKLSFGPIITAFNEKTFGNENIINKYLLDYTGGKTKTRLKYGVFLDYQISKKLSLATNFQFSEPINKILVFGFNSNSGLNKLLPYSEKRLNSELLLNYLLIELKKPIKSKLVIGVDYNKIVSIDDNSVDFTDPIDLEYGELLNLAGSSFKKDYFRYILGIKAEYKKLFFTVNTNIKLGGSIADSFYFKNTEIYNNVTNRSLNFSIGYNIR
jgi:hypothetical protein